jgi:hypothetical protein
MVSLDPVRVEMIFTDAKTFFYNRTACSSSSKSKPSSKNMPTDAAGDFVVYVTPGFATAIASDHV